MAKNEFSTNWLLNERHEVVLNGELTGVNRIQRERMEATKHRINTVLSKHTGQLLEKIERDTNRDYYMTVEEALEYGKK